MASELAKQLQKKVHFVGGVDMASAKSRPSFMYNYRTAVNKDNFAIYTLAEEGLQDLIGLDAQVHEPGRALINPASLDMDRALLDQETSAEVDRQIEALLPTLTPHFQLRATAKVLEWLIRRYRVNEFNVSALVRAFIPYHQTPAFLMLIQTIPEDRLRDTPFAFLQACINHRVPLEIQTLISHTRSNRDLLELFQKDCLTLAQRNTEKSTAVPRVVTAFLYNLFTAYVLDHPTFSESEIRFFMPLVMALARVPCEDVVLIAFAVIDRLVTRVKFTPNMFNRTVKTVLNASASTENILLALLPLVQTQALTWTFSSIILGILVRLPQLVPTLLVLRKTYVLQPLVEPLLHSLVLQFTQDPNKYLSLFETLLRELNLPRKLVATLATQLFDQMAKQYQHPMEKPAPGSVAIPGSLLRLLDQQYPRELGQAFTALLEYMKKENFTSDCQTKVIHTLNELLHNATQSQRYSLADGSTTPTFLALVHPEASVRVMAFRALVEPLNNDPTGLVAEDKQVLDEFLLRSLEDGHAQVLDTILATPFPAYIDDSELLISQLMALIHRADSLEKTTAKALANQLLVLVPNHRPALGLVVARLLLPHFLGVGPMSQFRKALLKDLDRSPLRSLFPGARSAKSTDASLNVQLLQKLGGDLVAAQFADTPLLTVTYLLDQIRFGTEPTGVVTHTLLAGYYLAHQAKSAGSAKAAQPHDSSLVDLILQLVARCRTLLGQKILPRLPVEPVDDLPSPALQQALGSATPDLTHVLEVLLFSLNLAMRHLPRPVTKAPLNWFNVNHQSSDEKSTAAERDYQSAVLGTAFLAFESVEAVSPLIHTLVDAQLESDWIPFLVAIWTDASFPDQIRATALALTGSYLEAIRAAPNGGPRDLQLFLPIFFAGLFDPSPVMRRLVLRLLPTLVPVRGLPDKYTHEAAITDNVYLADRLYGPATQSVVFLSPRHQQWLMNELLQVAGDDGASTRVIMKCVKRLLNDPAPGRDTPAPQAKHIISALQSYATVFGPGPQQFALLQFLAELTTITKAQDLPNLLRNNVLQLSRAAPGEEGKPKAESVSQASARAILDLVLTRTVHRSLQSLSVNTQLWQCLLTLADPTSPAYEGRLRQLTDEQREWIQLTVIKAIKPYLIAQMSHKHQAMFLHFALHVAQTTGPQTWKALLAVLPNVRLNPELLNQELTQVVTKCFRDSAVNSATTTASPGSLKRGQQPESAATTPGKTKKGRVEDVPDHSETRHQVLQQLLALLELLQAIEYPSVVLAPSLFTCLAGLTAGPSPTAAAPVSLEYVKQIALQLLTDIFKSLADLSAEAIQALQNSGAVRPDVLIQCIRGTTNTQTHRACLTLLGQMAILYPDEVLHHAMPIFTFMGMNILHHDDEYTFTTIQSALQNILSALATNHGLRTSSSEAAKEETWAPTTRPGVSLPVTLRQPLGILVDAWSHIPKHRRVAFYATVIDSFGARSFLAVLWAVLVERQGDRWLKSFSVETQADTFSDFSVDLAANYPVDIQLGALEALLHHLQAVPLTPGGEQSSVSSNEANGGSDALLLDIRTATTKSLKQYHTVTLQLIHKMTLSEDLLRKVMASRHDGGLNNTKLFDSFLSLTEGLLAAHDRLHQFNRANPAGVKGWSDTMDAVEGGLASLQRFMDLRSFSDIAQRLLNNPARGIVHQGLVMVHNKLQPLASVAAYHLSSDDQEAVLALVPLVFAALQPATSTTIVDEFVDSSLLTQMALLNLAHLTTLLASTHPTVFTPGLALLAGPSCLGHSHSQVVASSLVCLIHYFRHLQTRAVLIVTSVMQQTVAIVGRTLSSNQGSGIDTDTGSLSRADATVLIAALRLLEEVVVRLPQFAVAYAAPVAAALFHPRFWPVSKSLTQYATLAECRASSQDDSDSEMSDAEQPGQNPADTTAETDIDDVNRELVNHARELITAMSTHLNRSEFLPHLFTLYDQVLVQPLHVLVAYLDTLAFNFKVATSDEQRDIYPAAVLFMLRALDFRQEMTPLAEATQIDERQIRFCAADRDHPLGVIDLVEQRMVTVFMQFSMKLNEMMFKPLLLKLVAWATGTSIGDDSQPAPLLLAHRQTTLFHLVDSLVLRLRSIATPYYMYVLPHTLRVLKAHTVLNDIPAQLSKVVKTDTEALPAIRVASSVAQWTHALESLTHTLEHDKDDFCRPQVFEQLLTPMVQQVVQIALTTKSTTVAASKKQSDTNSMEEDDSASEHDDDDDSDDDDVDADTLKLPAHLTRCYTKRIQEVVAPALGALAKRYNKEDQWKALNHQVLMFTRNPHNYVRVAALLIIQHLYNTLKEELLILLPETIPFLFEVIEDEDPWVEKTAQQTVNLIEQYLGEPLRRYFE
ncbi:snoRNA-binding rRNA-processing protein utp10 [Dimargaris cristalligena]|nr:snoRNA-binding rRNA-processing protein utp10 [Dimargaris cristalligena]